MLFENSIPIGTYFHVRTWRRRVLRVILIMSCFSIPTRIIVSGTRDIHKCLYVCERIVFTFISVFSNIYIYYADAVFRMFSDLDWNFYFRISIMFFVLWRPETFLETTWNINSAAFTISGGRNASTSDTIRYHNKR